MSTTAEIKSKRQHLTGFLISELGGVENVKDFSNQLRFLGLCDLKDDQEFLRVTGNGGELLGTLVSWYQLGFVSKMVYLKEKIKEI